MKTSMLLVSTSLVALTGCSVAARSPQMYADDTKAVLEKKNDDIRACYDGVLKSSPGAAGKVTVNFVVMTETGKITDVAVDKAGTTAPDPVAECVTKAIDGLSLSPADVRKGEGTWVYEFTAPPPPAPPPAAAAPEKS
jgi:hypothetical protein